MLRKPESGGAERGCPAFDWDLQIGIRRAFLAAVSEGPLNGDYLIKLWQGGPTVNCAIKFWKEGFQ